MIDFLLTKILFLSLCGTAVYIIMSLAVILFGSFMSAKQKYGFILAAMLFFIIPANIPKHQTQPEQAQNSDTIPVQQEITSPSEQGQVQTEIQQTAVKSENTEYRAPEENTRINVLPAVKKSIPWIYFTAVVAIVLKRLYALIKFRFGLKEIAMKPSGEMLADFNRLNKSGRVSLKCFDGISSPFVTGIFRPVIFMPENGMTKTEFEMALRHELNHIKRNDLLIKIAADVISVIHFFNPFTYILKHQIDFLAELSCDEDVTKNMDISECKHYGKMLLSLMKKRNTENTLCLSENEKNITRRLDIIMKKHTLNRLAAIVTVVVFAMTLFSGAVLAGTIAGFDNSSIRKMSYKAEVYNINMIINDNYTRQFSIVQNGTAVFTDVLGKTSFKATYYTLNDYDWAKHNTLDSEEKYDEADEIIDNKNNYTVPWELTMTKQLRRYGEGHYIEGLFTLKQNGKPVFQNAKGYLSNLPPDDSNELYPNDTTLYIKTEQNGNVYEYRTIVKLDVPTPERYKERRILNSQFNKSSDTRAVRLGDLIEMTAYGRDVDVTGINEQIADGMPWDKYFTEIKYNPDMDMARAGFDFGAFDGMNYAATLSLQLGEKAVCDNDTIKGSFSLYSSDHVEDVIPVEISGLSNPEGGFVEVKSDDGQFYAKYTIMPYVEAPLSVTGTREVSEFITEGEEVFIGTPRQQDEFDRSEHDRLYKRIIVDDYGKVLAVVPVEYQCPPITDMQINSATSTGYTWSMLLEHHGYIVDENGEVKTLTLKLQDMETWWIRAVIPPEYQFFNAPE